MPRTEGSGSRRAPRRRSRPRLLVVCGGERTEPAYLKGLRDKASDRAVDVKIMSKGQSPAQVVEYALTRAGADFDDVWCVLDVDEFDLAPAERLATKEGVRLAVSNPCFELWLLLHHEDCTSACKNCAIVVRKLKQHVPRYDKTRLNFAHYEGGITDAIVPAKALDASGVDHTRNPSTGVWTLAEMILEAA